MIEIDEFVSYLEREEIPPTAPRGTSLHGYDLTHYDTIDGHKARLKANDMGMWAIVTEAWTGLLADWIGERRCLEIMAGAGWLAKALHEFGVDIIATDNFSWQNRHSQMSLVYDVEKLDAVSAIKRYSDADILIVSWPPYEDSTICKACELWGGEKPIIYIGEDEGGCNAPDEFFRHFDPLDIEIPLMCWYGIHDRIFIGYYQRNMR